MSQEFNIGAFLLLKKMYLFWQALRGIEPLLKVLTVLRMTTML